MCPLSYALVSSSTSTMTTPGSPIWASAQSASTRTSDRLMWIFLLLRSRPLGGRPDPLIALDEQIDLAAQADIECGVEEGRDQRERGEHDAACSRPAGVADHPGGGDDHA